MRPRVLVVLLLSVLVTSADAVTRPSRAGHLTRPSAPAASDPLELRHCLAGCPAIRPGHEDRLPPVSIRRRGYVLLHSSEDKIPRWVAEYVTRAQLRGDGVRSSAFAPDPKLPEDARAELADYRKSGYDRGHCAPAGNFGSQRLKDESFFLSNMTPQHPKLNQELWRALEERTRKWVESRGSAYELTGGFFYDPAEDNPRTRDGKVTHDVIGDNQVAVPTHYYKIIVAKAPSTKQWESIAFVAENRAYSKPKRQPYDFRPLLTSIDWIEDKTGIDFMPALNKSEERRLESRVATLWP